MKRLLYMYFIVGILAGCKTDYNRMYDNNMDFYSFDTNLSQPYSPSMSPNYEYEGRFKGVTFNMSLPGPTIPNSLFDENGLASGELQVTPIYLGQRQKPLVFNISFNRKEAGRFEFRHAPGDELRLVKGTEDQEQYTQLSYSPKYQSDFFSAAFVFQDIVLPELSAYIHKSHRTGKLLIYQRSGKNFGRFGGKFDPEGEQPEMVIDNYSVPESGANIVWIRPLGSPIELWKDENASQYTMLNAKVVYGGGDAQNWLFTYNGDKMSRNSNNYVRKDNLSGTIKVFKQNNTSFNDVTFLKEVPGPFHENQELEFILNGSELVPNTYEGPNPTSPSHSFFRLGYKKLGGNVNASAVKIKVSMEYTDPTTGQYKTVLLREENLNRPANGQVNYGAPFEVDWAVATIPGMPDPEWDIQNYLPTFSFEVTDGSTGAVLARSSTGFFYEESTQYLKPYNQYDLPSWPITPKYKQMNIIFDTSDTSIGFAYGSGLWGN